LCATCRNELATAELTLFTVVLTIAAFLKMDKFIVNFYVFGVGKTFEDWLKSDEDYGMTKFKRQGPKAKDISPFTISFHRS
jgi:hypothetical protein